MPYPVLPPEPPAIVQSVPVEHLPHALSEHISISPTPPQAEALGTNEAIALSPSNPIPRKHQLDSSSRSAAVLGSTQDIGVEPIYADAPNDPNNDPNTELLSAVADLIATSSAESHQAVPNINSKAGDSPTPQV
jgi:hypothetical protein